MIADVTNHSFKEKTGYHYFDLVEKADGSNSLVTKMAGKAWGAGGIRIREFEHITGQRFTNNINVLIRVQVNFHAVYGLSLELQDIDTHFTIGVLEQQRQTTLAQLVANNPAVIRKVGDRYITRNAELPLPKVIQRIAVVSSKTSAGNEDFKHTLMNNSYGYRFAIDDYFTIVQNDAYASDFLERLIDVFKSGIAYDAVVINRGGGAQTDFLMFDNYKIGLAVARFPIPIITGIGHQKNETIADLMAHTQTKTPTQAAEFIIAHNKRFDDSLLQLQQRILIKTQQLFSNRFQQLTQYNSSIVNNTRTLLNEYKDALVGLNQIVVNDSKQILFDQKNKLLLVGSTLTSKPRIITGNKQNDLQNIMQNILSFQKSYLKNQRGYLQHYVSVINMMSPANILKKGFALVKINGEISSDPDKLTTGSAFDVILSNQTIHSTVESKTPYNGKDFNLWSRVQWTRSNCERYRKRIGVGGCIGAKSKTGVGINYLLPNQTAQYWNRSEQDYYADGIE